MGVSNVDKLGLSVATDLTATGSTRANALALSNSINNITTAAASTGVVLPAGTENGFPYVGQTIRVFNNGANSITVYAPNSETINGTAGSTGVALANAKVADYTYVKANTWISVTLN